MNYFFIETQAPDTPALRRMLRVPEEMSMPWRKTQGKRYTTFERAMQAKRMMSKGTRWKFRVRDARKVAQ